MTRLIEHDGTGPLTLDESDLDSEKGDVAVCLCGLSTSHSFCDGSHLSASDEDERRCYRYVEREDGELEARPVERLVYADGTSESLDPEDD